MEEISQAHPKTESRESRCLGAIRYDSHSSVTHKETFLHIYTLLDVYSRWAYAWVSQKLSAGKTVAFLKKAQEQATFDFHMLQTDHGPEFSKWFTSHAGIQHRHSRVRKPNDNAHLERFNRTIQEECLYGIREEPLIYQAAIEDWLPYYNDERPHLSLEFLSPSQVVRRY